ncbi:MAG TPA: RIP metalloprotease RseP [Verrucomicrobiae bacterium]|nr:RIP metalloprotease RseP [Verrucomicrobiae bacterium]
MQSLAANITLSLAAAGDTSLVQWVIWGGTWVAAVFFLALTIFVHELGHFLAARWRRLVVDRFSIGFGPGIWSRKIDGVDWCVSAIPVGGYVSLPQLAPMELIEGPASSDAAKIPPAHPRDKIIVAFAGPLFSFLLALATAVLVWVVGRPSQEAERSAVIGYVLKDGPAAQAPLPLMPGDKVLAVDNRPVTSFGGPRDSVVEAVVFSKGEKIQFDVERTRDDGATEIITTLIRPRKDEITDLREVGIASADRLLVGKLLPNSPAAAAGLRVGDELVALGGKRMYSRMQFIDAIAVHGVRPIELTYLRGGRMASVPVTPEVPSGSEEPKIGIQFDMPPPVIVHPSPQAQIAESSAAVLEVLRALVDRKSHIGPRHMMSPVGMVDSVSRLLDVDMRLVLWYAVVINVNLALLNILPIPVLDGGHIVFSLVEWVRRRALPAQLIHGLQSAFAMLLIAFMVYVMFYDTRRVVRQRIEEHEMKEKARGVPELAFPPEPSPAVPKR